MNIRKLLAVTTLVALGVAAIASASIVGKWKGHIEMDWSKMPKNKFTPQQIAETKKRVAGLSFVFDFKPNKTYVVTGGPRGPQSGTWSEKGDSVTINSSSPMAKGRMASQTFQLTKNGKAMVFSTGQAIKVVLARS